MFNWNDLNSFLTLTRCSKLKLASKKLKVEPTTIARRISRLESNLESLSLEKARSGSKWLIINQPPVSDRPYGPSKKRVFAIGCLIGLLLSYSISYAKYIISSKAISIIDYEKYLKIPPILSLDIKSTNNWERSLDLLSNNPQYKNLTFYFN